VTDFTRTNLEDIDGGDGPVQAHFARKHLDSRQLGVSLFRYAPNFKGPFGHHHETQEEAYVVVGGSGRMKLDDEIIELKRWDVVRVAPEVVRAFEGGPDGLELVAVGGDKPPEGDGVKVDDFWT
jgi:mannose-6-phosphate isomerase-like protein (cupin superfamily)